MWQDSRFREKDGPQHERPYRDTCNMILANSQMGKNQQDDDQPQPGVHHRPADRRNISICMEGKYYIFR
jgi:hypothetical protein